MTDEVSNKLDLILKEVRAIENRLRTDPRSRIESYTVKELAGLAKRHPQYVSDRCRMGRIKTLPGKPYRIPPIEAAKFLGLLKEAPSSRPF
jgi:hypothetical protein